LGAAGLLLPAGNAAVPVAAGDATVPPPGLLPANRASPVVVLVAVPRGWVSNLIWLNGTAMSRSPRLKYPPIPITTTWTLPLLSKIRSSMLPILSPLLLL
jgi:ABC-type glycerol-3-phosphate transport system substrate-binding protein